MMLRATQDSFTWNLAFGQPLPDAPVTNEADFASLDGILGLAAKEQQRQDWLKFCLDYDVDE